MAIVTKWRVHYFESERGWGQDWWHNDFDTREEAKADFDWTNAQLNQPTVPDVYIKADSIEEIQIQVEDEDMTKRETATERRAREAAEAQAAAEAWERVKPARLLRAMASATSLIKPGLAYAARVFLKYEDVMYYEFRLGKGYEDYFCDTVEGLSEYQMVEIERRLEELHEAELKRVRLEKLRQDVLGRLTEEEREALGL